MRARRRCPSTQLNPSGATLHVCRRYNGHPGRHRCAVRLYTNGRLCAVTWEGDPA